MENNRAVLLRRLQVCDFVLIELQLYLDGHPTDREALAMYTRYKTMRCQAAEEYTRAYGPIDPLDFCGGERWNWVDGPWPGEKEGN
ncbi:MAG: spore coat protein CotJB [Christensenellaceae bacterium]|nr:spore coat protein CotJB [Christensenellaceae bacterium]